MSTHDAKNENYDIPEILFSDAKTGKQSAALTDDLDSDISTP